MLLHIIARGKIARSPEADLVARYEKRLTWPVKLTELPETGGRVPEAPTPFRTVLLDERGKDISSEKLASVLGRWRDDGIRETRFVLGAADGHSRSGTLPKPTCCSHLAGRPGRICWPARC